MQFIPLIWNFCSMQQTLTELMIIKMEREREREQMSDESVIQIISKTNTEMVSNQALNRFISLSLLTHYQTFGLCDCWTITSDSCVCSMNIRIDFQSLSLHKANGMGNVKGTSSNLNSL